MNKLTKEEFAEFSHQVGLALTHYSCLRRGQAMMNELYRIRPELYEAITATKNDPYYLDARIPEFTKQIVDI